jgi:aldehyde dehydrogenase (NAD+)
LSLYIFSTRQQTIDKFLNETSSGSVCANDAIIHLTIDALPFGGVGESGIGAYHGRYSFETFSHQKSGITTKCHINRDQRLYVWSFIN